MINTVQCSICSQLNNMPRVVVTDFRLHLTCSIVIWVHSLKGRVQTIFVKNNFKMTFMGGRGVKHNAKMTLFSAKIVRTSPPPKWCY